MTKLKIHNYINNQYREYSIYTNNNRAIPSSVDGFKPVQRKAIYAAFKECKTKFTKVAALGGSMSTNAAYHHGNVSAEEAIVKLAQDFKNNVTYFDRSGTFGTRQSPTAGASRYIFVKLSENFEHIYKDNDILPYSLDTEDSPEPLYYLPIIPTVLLNGTSGMAVGFSTKIASRSIQDLSEQCLNYLNGKEVQSCIPSFPKFSGTVEHVVDSKYKITGKFERTDYKVTVTELPISFDHEKYITVLDKLKSEKKIVSYEDNTSDNFHFSISLPRNKKLTDDEIIKLLKLQESFSEMIIIADEFNKSEDSNPDNLAIELYNDHTKLIKEFVDFRLTWYQRRIDTRIQEHNYDIDLLKEKLKFIEMVNDGSINIKEVNRKELVKILTDKKFNKLNIEKLISMPIYNLTKEKHTEYTKELERLVKSLDGWTKQTTKKLYIKDLKDLQKHFK